MKDNLKEYNYSEVHKALEQLQEDLSKLDDIIMVSIRGLAITRQIPNVVTAVAQYKEAEDTEEHKESLRNAEKLATIAKEEIQQGFPFLFAQSAVMLYSYLEAAIKGMIITFIKDNDTSKIKEIASIKLSYGDFIHLDEYERFDYLFSQYEKGLAAGIQYGITRFETLLAPIFLSGHVGNETSKALFELSQIRNNILHRGGKADNHFTRSCPWLSYTLGDTVKVTKVKYQEYYSAIGRYLIVLLVRLADKTGKNMDKFRGIE